MNILHINTLDNRGGAGKALMRLTGELKRLGHTISTFVGYKKSGDPTVHEIPRNPFYYRLSKFFANDLRFSRSDWILKTDQYKKADIVHFHNIHSGFFNLKTLETISREKPTVWTVQDTWPFTSGCTDSYHCRLDKPRRVAGILWDNRKYLLDQRRKIYKNSRLTLVTSSRWMAEQLTGSILDRFPKHLIHNGINTSIFTPRDKIQMRKELGLPLDKKIILFIAVHGAGDHLKGADYIRKIALDYGNDNDKFFVAIGGHKRESSDSEKTGSAIFETGYISDEMTLAKYYSAADLFLYPSRADNSPIVVTESMACGTPVVSFDTDGITEMLSGGCGFLAQPENIEDLKHKMENMLSLSPSEYAEMSALGIKKIKENYPVEKMANDYLALYAEVIKKS